MASAWQEIKELHKASTFGAKEGVAFRYFSRPLASLILYFIQNGRITPNQVTILSLIVGLIGSGLHAFDLTYRGLILGGVFFMLAHMLDALDGQLARHRKAGSVVGMYFDFFIDELKAYFILISISIRLFRQSLEGQGDFLMLNHVVDYFGGSHFGILYVAIAGLCGLSIGISATQFVKRDEWKEAFPAGTGSGKPSVIARVIGLIEKVGHFIVDYPSYILLLCIIDQIEIYFVVYSLTVCAYAVRAVSSIALKLWRINPYA